MTDDEDLDLDPDLDIEINLRAPAEVAARVIVLAAVCHRAYLERAEGDDGADDPEAERFDLVAWLRTEGLDPIASPVERHLLQTRLGRLGSDETDAASWQTEALAALAWAMGILEALPPYHIPVDPGPLLDAMPSPWDKTGPFRTGVRLRPEEEIAAERERAELWHWRATMVDLLLEARGKEAQRLGAVIREVAGEAARAGIVDHVTAGDFTVDGRPYRDLAGEALDVATAIAAERHRALNWLCGFGMDWDTVPTDV
ncbi:MAG: DUF4272 domain-containing protein [Chloroflexota bacterium]|nr:DUF4272 domain-containing protein [Chloroflexota bacterium]